MKKLITILVVFVLSFHFVNAQDTIPVYKHKQFNYDVSASIVSFNKNYYYWIYAAHNGYIVKKGNGRKTDISTLKNGNYYIILSNKSEEITFDDTKKKGYLIKKP